MTLGHSPLIICDSGHNIDGIKSIVEQIKKKSYDELHIVFGVVNNKSIDGILKLLPKKPNTISVKLKYLVLCKAIYYIQKHKNIN